MDEADAAPAAVDVPRAWRAWAGCSVPGEDSAMVVGRVFHEMKLRPRLRENHELLLLLEGLAAFETGFSTGTAMGAERRKRRENEDSTARTRRKTRRVAARASDRWRHESAESGREGEGGVDMRRG